MRDAVALRGSLWEFEHEGASQTGPLSPPMAKDGQGATIDGEPASPRPAATSREQARPRRGARVGSACAAPGLLSSRERSILEHIGQGKSNKEIAKDLCITPETVKSHVKNIFIKLAVRKRAQAVARAQGLALALLDGRLSDARSRRVAE